jgi:hypothetical protein
MIDHLERSETPPHGQDVGPEDDNTTVDLGRLAWLGTVLVCTVVVLVLVIQGYYGYAGVTFSVALAAGINLV